MVTILFCAIEILHVRNAGRRSIKYRYGLVCLSASHERSPGSARLTRVSLIMCMV